jgi:hypothetical protein
VGRLTVGGVGGDAQQAVVGAKTVGGCAKAYAQRPMVSQAEGIMEAVVEMVKTVHHGENRGKKPVVLYMFYLSQKDLPLAVQQ